jgi:hypothetical protein
LGPLICGNKRFFAIARRVLEKARANPHNGWQKMTQGEGALARACQIAGDRGSDMKKSILMAVCLAVAVPVFSSFASAGPIEGACNRSHRKASSRQLCGCIQQVADQTLRGSDQRRAASFFKDPEKANKTWQSKSNADDAFWDRYKAFGEQAEAYCGG